MPKDILVTRAPSAQAEGSRKTCGFLSPLLAADPCGGMREGWQGVTSLVLREHNDTFADGSRQRLPWKTRQEAEGSTGESGAGPLML